MRIPFAFVLLLVDFTPGLPAQEGASVKQSAAVPRAPVPDAAKQKEAEKTVRELFKAEYAKKQPAERSALAKKLLQQGKASADDAVAQWVLYREAQDVAAQAGDIETAVEAAQAMSVSFEIESVAAKTAALAAAAKALKTPEEAGRLAEQYLKITDEAAVTDDYDSADKALAAANANAKRAANAALSLRLAARGRELADLKARYEKLKKAYDTVAKNPADPAANAEIGQFQCFVKGDWAVGLSFLAKGSDPVLGTLAAKDLANPGEPEKQLEVADGWWDLADKEKGDRQKRVTQRAALWYEKCAAGLNGLQKAKAQTRLDTVRKKALAQGLDVTLGASPVSRGLELRNNDDGRYEPITVAGKTGVKLIHHGGANGATYLYFKVQEAWQESWKPAEIDIEYYDDGGGFFEIEYDGVSGVYRNSGKKVQVGSSKTWKVATFPVPEPLFKNRLNAGSDFRIVWSPGGQLHVARAAVRLVLK